MVTGRLRQAPEARGWCEFIVGLGSVRTRNAAGRPENGDALARPADVGGQVLRQGDKLVPPRFVVALLMSGEVGGDIFGVDPPSAVSLKL
jgi:hypothetical protein